MLHEQQQQPLSAYHSSLTSFSLLEMDDCGLLISEDLDTFLDFFDEDVLDQDTGLIEQTADVETDVSNGL